MPARFAVILPAAGRSIRFGVDKLAQCIGGRPVLQHSVLAFLNRPDVAQVILAVSDFAQTHAALTVAPSSEAILVHEKITICPGGACRAESVRAALMQIDSKVDWVAVHDAARPLISQELIDTVFAAAVEHGAAVPAMAVHLTVKQATGPLPARVIRTLPRHELWAMQTPQVMSKSALQKAFDCCPLSLDQITDDVQLLELAGDAVWLVPGQERNLKVTTPLDLQIAQGLLQNTTASQ